MNQRPGPVGLSALSSTPSIRHFFPIFWMALAAFKHEIDAVATPPKLFFEPTLENFAAVQARADYFRHMLNSVVVSLGSTAIVLALAIPAAYVAAFFPTKKTPDLLLWMLSTKMMPAVGVLVPMYLIFKNLGLLVIDGEEHHNSVFAIGTTTVTATVADPGGNTATCSFTVTVNDNEAPVATCPASITASNAKTR